VMRIAIRLSVIFIGSFVLASATNLPAQDAPVKESTVIAVGVVQEILSIIRPDKLSHTRTLADGRKIVELPIPAEYMAGTLYRVRVEDVIKGERKVGKGTVISVLIGGSGSLHALVLVKDQRFVIFLSPLKGDDEYKGTLVMSHDNNLSSSKQFNAKGSYVVVSGRAGVIPVTATNRKMINEVKAAVRNSR